MKLAVISDVHANLEALEAVFDLTQGLEVYCLGDLVDYGANPNEVIELVRKRGVKSIVGNHDVAALTGDTSLFNPRAAMSAVWTARNLTANSRDYLRGLPEEFNLDLHGTRAYFTHGSPDDRLWEYVDPRTHSDLFGYYLDKKKVDVIGLGHTHIPYVWREGERVVINPGSVGQPRDGDRRASYALVEPAVEGAKVEVVRIDYDYAKAAGKIRAAGLPSAHADRLLSGS